MRIVLATMVSSQWAGAAGRYSSYNSSLLPDRYSPSTADFPYLISVSIACFVEYWPLKLMIAIYSRSTLSRLGRKLTERPFRPL